MAKISVSKIGEEPYKFEVVIKESGSSSSHTVEMKKGFYKNLDTKTTPEEVVKKSFDFLLEREPKESILGSFNIEVISNYFPNFSQKVKEF